MRRCGAGGNNTSPRTSAVTEYVQLWRPVEQSIELLHTVSDNTAQRTPAMNADPELFKAYAFYAAVVTVKVLMMAFLTARFDHCSHGSFVKCETFLDILSYLISNYSVIP